MASFADPSNKRAQQALGREITPPFREVVPAIAGWGSGGSYFVAMFALAQALPYWFLQIPVATIGFLTCWLVGMMAMMGTDIALTKRDERQAARCRQLGHILDMSNQTMQVWWQVVNEAGLSCDHVQVQPAAHYDLLLRIRRFDEAIPEANEADKARLLDRIKQEITDELAGVAEQLQVTAEGSELTAKMVTAAHHDYVNALLGQ